MQIKEKASNNIRGYSSVDVKGLGTYLSLKEDSDTSNILKFYIVPVG